MDNKITLPCRKSVRLPDYNYSQEGMYFITICTHQSRSLFGNLDNDSMTLNELGQVLVKSWAALPRHFPHITTDKFIIMPNHMHGIITILEGQSNISQPTKGASRSLGSIVRCLKVCVTKWARKNTEISDVWHRNYYEHVIRDEKDYQRIAEYIEYNPLRRNHDEMYHHG